MDANLRVGEHTLTLRGVSSEGSSGEDTVLISVVGNDPPSVALTTPAPFSHSTRASWRTQPLDSL